MTEATGSAGRVWTSQKVAARLRLSVAVARAAVRTVPRGTLSLGAVCLAVAGCGSDDPQDAAVPPRDNGPSGRPIGSPPQAESAAIAAAVGFARGYFDYLAGERDVDEIPHVTRELERSLRSRRVPLAARGRQTTVARAVANRLDARSARVTITATNVAERFSYPLPLDLVRRGGRWRVLTIPDDR